jgi:hypothetical protein
LQPETKYKLDRTAFKKRKHGDEMFENRLFWLSKSPIERLEAAYLLSLSAYGLDNQLVHRLDKSVFSKRKHE